VSTTTPDADLRCPQCAAHVRSGSDWCTLCYADLRPAPAPAPAAPAPVPAGEGSIASATNALPQTSAAGHHAVDTTTTTPAADSQAARRGKHAKHSSRPSAAETEALAAQLLAQLAAEESGSPLGRLSSLTDTTGKKAGLMIGGAAALTLLAFALMALIGAFL
jgi:hypothetical protein